MDLVSILCMSRAIFLSMIWYMRSTLRASCLILLRTSFFIFSNFSLNVAFMLYYVVFNLRSRA